SDPEAGRRAEDAKGRARSGALRSGDGKASDRARAEDESDPRSAGQEGSPKVKLFPAISAIAALIVMCGGATAFAQRGGGFGQRGGFGFGFGRPDPPVQNAKYDGRFAFARLKYTTGPGGYYYCGGLPAWAHGYFPCGRGTRAEDSLMKIMNEVSYLNPHIEESEVLALDDPELAKYPVAYMTEAGFWTLTD